MAHVVSGATDYSEEIKGKDRYIEMKGMSYLESPDTHFGLNIGNN